MSAKSLESQISTLTHELQLSTFLNKGILQTNTEHTIRIAELERENTTLRSAERRLTSTEEALDEAERRVKELERDKGDWREKMDRRRLALKTVEKERDEWKSRFQAVVKIWETAAGQMSAATTVALPVVAPLALPRSTPRTATYRRSLPTSARKRKARENGARKSLARSASPAAPPPPSSASRKRTRLILSPSSEEEHVRMASSPSTRPDRQSPIAHGRGAPKSDEKQSMGGRKVSNPRKSGNADPVPKPEPLSPTPDRFKRKIQGDESDDDPLAMS